MNDSEVKELKKIIILTAAYYGKEIRDEVVKMYICDLSDLDFKSVAQAYDKYRRSPENKFAPIPAQIRNLIAPTADPKIEAREAASRVIEAIGRYGYTNPQQARTYVGELGWKMVERFGGWSYICEHTGVKLNATTLLAQMRDVGEALMIREQGGYGDRPPELGETNSAMSRVLEMAKPKQITEGDEDWKK